MNYFEIISSTSQVNKCKTTPCNKSQYDSLTHAITTDMTHNTNQLNRLTKKPIYNKYLARKFEFVMNNKLQS